MRKGTQGMGDNNGIRLKGIPQWVYWVISIVFLAGTAWATILFNMNNIDVNKTDIKENSTVMVSNCNKFEAKTDALNARVSEVNAEISSIQTQLATILDDVKEIKQDIKDLLIVSRTYDSSRLSKLE